MSNKDILSIEIAEEVMKKRGYTRVATSGDNKRVFFNKILPKEYDGAGINAEVKLISKEIEIKFADLKLAFILSSYHFDFYTDKWKQFEETLMMYINACVHANERYVPSPTTPEKKETEKNILQDRKKEFWNKVKEIGKEKGYSKEACEAFYKHWTAMNDNGNKMLFEITKSSKKSVWSTAGRLATWMKNEKDWAKPKTTKIEIQNKELVKKKEILETKDVF